MQISLLLARDVQIGGMGGVTPSPNIFKLTKKLVKRQPCWKRAGNSNFCDLFFCLSNNSWSIGQKAPHGIEIPQPGETLWFNRSLKADVIFENCFAIYS